MKKTEIIRRTIEETSEEIYCDRCEKLIMVWHGGHIPQTIDKFEINVKVEGGQICKYLEGLDYCSKCGKEEFDKIIKVLEEHNLRGRDN